MNSKIKQRNKRCLLQKKCDFKKREIWKLLHRILKPNKSMLKADTNELNKYLNKTAKRLNQVNYKPNKNLSILQTYLETKMMRFNYSQYRVNALEKIQDYYKTTVLKYMIIFQYLLSNSSWISNIFNNIYIV